MLAVLSLFNDEVIEHLCLFGRDGCVVAIDIDALDLLALGLEDVNQMFY
jgi:hypothetical protein